MMGFLLSGCVLAGCGQALPSAASGPVSASNQSLVASIRPDSNASAPGWHLDLGLVDALSNQRVYLPLDGLDIADPEHVESTNVSCECVTFNFAEYLTRDGRWQPALCIEIHGESEAVTEEMRPVDLAVQGTIQLTSGETRQLTISFTHTPMRSGLSGPVLAGGTVP